MEGMLPKWLLDWLSRLLPSHHSSGSGAVHIGKLKGNFTTVHNHIQVVETPLLDDEKLELLRSIRKLPRRGESVFNFMERKFRTRMVMDLRPNEMREVQWYVAGINRRMAGKPSKDRGVDTPPSGEGSQDCSRDA